MQPNPFAASVIPDLQAITFGSRKDREQVHVLMAEEAARPRAVLCLRHRRIIVEPQSEIGLGQLAIVDVRIAAEALENGLCDRLDQRLMCFDQAAELELLFRKWPIFFGIERRIAFLRDIEGTPAP